MQQGPLTTSSCGIPRIVGEVRHRRRVGWLLRVNRLLGARPRFRRLTAFAKEFSRENSVKSATIATFSRWENGISAVTHSAVRRYEQLLELPNLSMVSVIDTIARHMSPSAGSAPWLKRAPKPDAARIIEVLVDRARGEEVMTAQDWDELTNLLSRNPTVILSPTKAWAELSERLLHETSIADGTQWMPGPRRTTGSSRIPRACGSSGPASPRPRTSAACASASTTGCAAPHRSERRPSWSNG
jgi:hypothetical protein